MNTEEGRVEETPSNEMDESPSGNAAGSPRAAAAAAAEPQDGETTAEPEQPASAGGKEAGNEDKKIFVGGISYETSNEDLLSFFSQFGEVSQAQVKYDQFTGRSRGFAFVEFISKDSVTTVLKEKSREIKGKQVEIKPAKSRENKKIFIGGLPSDFPEDDLKTHFNQFGKIDDVEWPFDRSRGMRRNFAFIVFEDESAADAASAETKQKFGDRMCDVKKAVPQPKRAMLGMNTGRGSSRGGGRGGGRGGANGQWGQHYGGGWGGGYGAGGWGDWYGGAGYSNYYGNNGGYAGGGYGAGGDAPAYADYGASGDGYNNYWSGGWQYGGGQQQAGGQQTPSGYESYSSGQTGQSSQGNSANRGGRYQPY